MAASGVEFFTLDEVNRLKIIQDVVDRRLTTQMASQRLGISDRQCRRLLSRYRESGPLGMANRRRGKPSNNQLPDGLAQYALSIIRDRYTDFGPTLACDKLAELHDVHLSKETVRSLNYNRRFAKAPRHDFDVHRPLETDDDLTAFFTWREPRRVSKSLTVQYDKVLYLIEDNELSRRAIGKYIEVWHYPDGHKELRLNGAVLPYSTYDRLQEIDQGAIVDNKRLGRTLEFIKLVQDKRDKRLVPLHPGRHDHRQSCSMGHIEQRRQRMLNHMVRIAESAGSGVKQTTQRLRGCPGELSAGVIVGGIFQQFFRAFQHRVHNSFHHPGLEMRLVRCGEITFYCMSNDIGGGINQIITAQGFHQVRVNDRHHRKQMNRMDRVLLSGFFVGDNRPAIHFTTGCGQRQDIKDRQRAVDIPLPDKQVPDITLITGSGCNRFCTVQHGTTAHAQHGINIILTRQHNTFTDPAQRRVTDNTATFHKGNTMLCKRRRHGSK